MKKPIDLNSLVESHEVLDSEIFEKYKNILNVKIKNTEINDIAELISNFKCQLNYFYVGYTIPQINKEFDLLRIGKDFILNIEIKSTFNEDKAKKQLIQNRYYLTSLGVNLYLFTFDSGNNILYFLEEEDLLEVEFDKLKRLIKSQNLDHISNIDELFSPHQFLISPFNDTDKFIEGEYFLTLQQEEHKRSIINNLPMYNLIEGKPGTGKTLLLYDLAKQFLQDKEIAIIHCGDLNEGHLKLKVNYGWNILAAKDYKEIENIQPDIVFIDETQRFWRNQLKWVMNYIEDKEINCILSIDPIQTLSLGEKNRKNKAFIIDKYETEIFSLSDKIRSNKELHEFIVGITNLGRLKNCKDYSNVSIHYFDQKSSAKRFVRSLKKEGWVLIDYTSQNYNGEAINRMRLGIGINAHEVIGQEFDNVIVSLGKSFYYDKQNKLNARNMNYYDTTRMFYQGITRARKKIMLLVVDNEDLFQNIISNIKC